MAKPGPKKRSIDWPSVWLNLKGSRRPGNVFLAQVPFKYRGFPHKYPEPLLAGPLQFDRSYLVFERSNLCGVAVEILQVSGFQSVGMDDDEWHGLLETIRRSMLTGEPFSFPVLAYEYAVIHHQKGLWFIVAVDGGELEYDGGGTVYRFAIENMLTTLPSLFFDEMGPAVRWAATVIQFEAGVTRLRNAETKLALESAENARFEHMQRILGLGFNLGADLARIINDAEGAVTSHRRRAKTPDPQAFDELIAERLVRNKEELAQNGPIKLAERWLLEADQARPTKFGLRLKELKVFRGKDALARRIKRIAKASGL